MAKTVEQQQQIALAITFRADKDWRNPCSSLSVYKVV